jgi:branched-chain amino acid aminotransferase
MPATVDATPKATPDATARSSLAPWAYHDGNVVPAGQAQVPVTTQALHYGTGVFEGIRAHRTSGGGFAVFRMAAHYLRFLDSCRLLRVELGRTAAELAEITLELLCRNGMPHAYVRPLAYKYRLMPGTPPGVTLANCSDALSIVVFNLPAYGARDGLRCAISPWTRPSASALPVRAKATGTYLNNALALDDARAAGYDDAILLNRHGQVAEASTSNVFVVRDGILRTPPVTADVLAGITRDTVRTLAADAGRRTDEQPIDPADLLLADEVFLTGTGLGVVPVVEVAGRPVADGRPGPVTVDLRARYERAVCGDDDRHADWLTPVPEHREERQA